MRSLFLTLVSIRSLLVIGSTFFTSGYTFATGKELPDSYQFQIEQPLDSIDVTFIPSYSSDSAKGIAIPAQLEPHRFALPGKLERKLNLKDNWTVVGEKAIWRQAFSAEQAYSINLRLANLKLPSEASIYFYSTDRSQKFGPLKLNDNHEIWTPIINRAEDDRTISVVLEINVDAKLVSEVKFTLDAVNLGIKPLPGVKQAEGCQFDVVCEQGAIASPNERAVALYSILGQFLCTGTLVNNQKNDGRAYFLTAQHCDVTPSSARSMIFYWNYQTSVCDGDRDGDRTQITSGATLRAYSDYSDFALLELDQTPPDEFLPYWSGIDATRTLPSTTYNIHHPQGREKALSFDFDQPSFTDLYADTSNDNAQYIRVSGWELGATTEGSSGSGLWSDAGYLIGTLTGGLASCSQPQAPDWFGRVTSHWSHHQWKYHQLAYWLAPDLVDENELLRITGTESCTRPEATISTFDNPVLGESIILEATTDSANTVEWDLNDDGEFDLIGNSVEYRYNFLYRGKVKIKITNPSGCVLMLIRNVSVTNQGEEVFPVGGRLSAFWNQIRTSDKGWRLDTSRKLEGEFSLMSDRIQDGQTAGIEYIHNYTASKNNFISFAVATSTKTGDKLKFYIDNQLVDQWEGANNWQVNYYPLEPGLHVFKWVYEKDDSDREGSDAVWIDAVSGFGVTVDSEEVETSGGGSFTFLMMIFLLVIKRKSRKLNRG